jgi:glycosyltransferase involved in cell wall biosynthesis
VASGPHRRPPVRRPAPRAVRSLVAAVLARLERRTQRARDRAAPLPDPHRPRVYFLLRSCYGIGGTNRTVINTANQLAELGYSVELISLLRPHPTPTFPVDERVQLTPLVEESTRTPLPGAWGRWESILPRRVRAVLSRRLDSWGSELSFGGPQANPRMSLLTDVLMLIKLRSLDPGVLVLTRPVLILAGARYATAAVRTLGQEHWEFHARSAGTRKKLIEHYRKLDALTVLTAFDEDAYRSALEGSSVEVRRLPNGVPRHTGASSDGSSTVVVSAGRLSREKGFDLLVRAWPDVAARHPDWHLRIFGGGPEKEALQSLVDSLGVGNNVHLMGPTNRMLDEMARASLFVLSSRFESFGMVLIEAMSVGLPVVSFDCPRGPREVLTDGEDSVLVPAEDVPALAAAVNEMIDDPVRRQQLSAAALRTAERYSLESVGRLWEDLLRDIASRPPAHR